MEVQKYDDIRPFRDEELPEVIDRLLQDPQFCAFILLVAPDVPIDTMKAQLRQIKGVLDFQQKVMHPIVRSVAKKTTDSLDLSGFKQLDKSHSYTYVSNHRDIILDSAFLDILLIEKNLDTFEIAIGDNLLIYPWISDLVRINKSFLVKRGLPVRQQLEASLELSSYMHDTIEERNQSIWIAQREGRAKDSNDRTQVSVLKMLNLGGSGSVLENIASMNLVPVSISYEYDPCDYLKAKEMQQKRDDPDYKKNQKDDILSMRTGLIGYKGRVFYKVSPCISEELLKMEESMHKNELYEKVADLMDIRIHQNYHLYPGNYIAADMLDGIDRFSQSYSASEKEHFAAYIKQQLDKIDLKNKDENFLRKSMLEMYSNPLKNKLEAEKRR
ncbi:MAG: 1-acyl-sn-glycerol-3-phosphate acyltransferase [Bacteroidales bacterium]|nr:1-acyl-sn-glycerol-3-phosphate acyltransferase [Bacteroidales bacterium]MDD4711897.1 1-acyl-sn-glycerol-3-phosphate acyltransferase [Bacteroidales bacterium]